MVCKVGGKGDFEKVLNAIHKWMACRFHKYIGDVDLRVKSGWN